ncbi:hypothetical protein ACQUFY_22290 [Robbsia andropogonis]|uniref:hypothetical protein n=1 Tax=Robbsia andropogonis TaxID=28092 RepID=UPI003D19E2C9
MRQNLARADTAGAFVEDAGEDDEATSDIAALAGSEADSNGVVVARSDRHPDKNERITAVMNAVSFNATACFMPYPKRRRAIH